LIRKKGTGKLCLTSAQGWWKNPRNTGGVPLDIMRRPINRDRFLSTDFGLREFAPSEIRCAVTSELHGAGVKSAKERVAFYRRFVYEKGGLIREVEDRSKGLELSGVDRFRYRTRYFTDSGIIGTKEFVSRVYQAFK
jgi:hypothetical protein